jgi:hypothetical protein
MTWQEFGALGEVLGAAAAIVLLAYVAYQIRQNSRSLEQSARATQAAIYQQSNDVFARTMALLAQDATLARIWRLGLSGEPLDADETVRFEAFLTALFSYLDDAYTQSSIGTFPLEGTVLDLGADAIREILSSVVARDW